ncbi:MAG: EI24 domain-containing protein [Ideonella sp.]|nr:EI24 domain-containing protein [Ideonella sp.]
MKLLLDSFWRAAAYCLHPRVIALSVLPLVLMSLVALAAGYFYWETAVAAVRDKLDAWSILGTLFDWLAGIGLPNLKAVLAPLVVVFVATPVIVVLSLLAVAVLMTPSMVALVADRRFPQLERRRGGSFLGAVVGGLGATVLAVLVLVISVPLWFVPPLVLVLPPLIWGWLTYRVMSYDVLSDHASAAERQGLMKSHRPALLAMGVISGYLGAAPSLVWASGVLFLALAPVLVPLAVWVYTLVFAFSSLWFAHYALAALQQQRAEALPVAATQVVDAAPPAPLPGADLPRLSSSDPVPPA